jgi:hypothetical protein
MAEQIDETAYDITTVSGHLAAIVGDDLQPDFYPQVKLKAWDNEANFSIRLDTAISGSDFEENEDGSVSWYSPYGDVIGTFYYFDDEEVENGCYEFELDLFDKPSSRIIPFTIRTKELDFFYQPALTQEEIDNGDFQPENVVGSYAVYHKTKANNKYKTGKAFHIFRPWAEDSNGWKVWCELNIDVATEILTITLPEDFYNDAVYPVKIDPTLGYTTVGASWREWGTAGIYRGNIKTAIENGTVDSYTAYTRYVSTTVKCVITNDSGVIITNGVSPSSSFITTESWKTINYTNKPSITQSTTYFIGQVCSSTGINLKYDAATSSSVRDTTNSASTPQNLGTWYVDNVIYSCYITYTAEAPSGYTHSVNGVAGASIASINGIPTANIAKVNGV